MPKPKGSVRDRFIAWANILRFPCYVKKVLRADDSGIDTDSIESNTARISKDILAPNIEDGKVSLFRMETLSDFWRLFVALHHWHSWDKIRLFAIYESELTTCNLINQLMLTSNNCDIPCVWLKNRHHDLDLSADQRKQLAERIAGNWRAPSPAVTLNHVSAETQEANAWGCYSVDDNSRQCNDCDPQGDGAPFPK